MKSEYKKYSIVMILCFLLGGFSIILYLLTGYTSLWRAEVTPSRFSNNSTELAALFRNNTEFARLGNRFSPDPATNLISPFSFILIFNGVILLSGGISIWKLTRDKELTSTKEKLTSLLLLPEERTILLELKKSKGSMTQAQIVRNTGMSKVKAHRVVSKLAAKGIIKKYPYGLTNKIVLEKEV